MSSPPTVSQKVDWVWEMLKLVFAPATLPGQDLPRAIFYDDFGQVDRKEWLCIQEAVVINDRQGPCQQVSFRYCCATQDVAHWAITPTSASADDEHAGFSKSNGARSSMSRMALKIAPRCA